MLLFLSSLFFIRALDVPNVNQLLIYDDNLDKQIVTQDDLDFLFDQFITTELKKFKMYILDMKTNLLKFNIIEGNSDTICIQVKIVLFLLGSFSKVKELKYIIINEKDKLNNIILNQTSLEILEDALNRIKNTLITYKNDMHTESVAIIPTDTTNYSQALIDEVTNKNEDLFNVYTQYIVNIYDNYKNMIIDIFD